MSIACSEKQTVATPICSHRPMAGSRMALHVIPNMDSPQGRGYSEKRAGTDNADEEIFMLELYPCYPCNPWFVRHFEQIVASLAPKQ